MSPVIELKTISNLIRAGKLGNPKSETIPQSFKVSICKYLYFSNYARMAGVKRPPNFTDTISITKTKCEGVPFV